MCHVILFFALLLCQSSGFEPAASSGDQRGCPVDQPPTEPLPAGWVGSAVDPPCHCRLPAVDRSDEYRELLTVAYRKAPRLGYFVPIVPDTRCLHAYDHWVFTSPHSCPPTASCGRAHRSEFAIGMHSYSVCDGSFPYGGEAAVELRGPIELPGVYVSKHMYGYYGISGGYYYFLPVSCFYHLEPVQQEEEIWFWRGMTLGGNWNFLVPGLRAIHRHTDPRIPMMMLNGTLPLYRHPYFSPDVYTVEGDQFCASYHSAGGSCVLKKRAWSEFARVYGFNNPCSAPTTWLTPEVLLHEGRRWYNFTHPLGPSHYCLPVEQSKRTFIQSLLDTILGQLVELTSAVLPFLLDAFARAVHELAVVLMNSSDVAEVFAFLVLHLCLYRFSSNFYHHAMLAVVYLARRAY